MNPIPLKSPSYAKIKIALLILIAFLFLLTPSSWAVSDREKANALAGEAIKQYEQKIYSDALKYGEQALIIYRKLGPEKPEKVIFGILILMGDSASHLIQYDKSIGYYSEALTVSKKHNWQKETCMTLLGMGHTSCDFAQYNKAMGYYNESLAISKKLPSMEKTISETLDHMGFVASKLEQYEKAMSYYTEALAIRRNFPGMEKEIASTFGNMGNVACDLAQYDKALDYSSQALAIFRKLPGMEKDIAITLNNMGNAASNLTQYDKAMSYYSEALKTIERFPSMEKEMVKTLNNIGKVAYKLCQYDIAMAFYSEALAISRKNNWENEISIILNNMGLVAGDLAQYDKAMSYFSEALVINRKNNWGMGIMDALGNMGNVAFDLAQYDKAMGYYFEALAMCKKLNMEEPMSSILINMGNVARGLIQYNKAMGYYDEAMQILTRLKRYHKADIAKANKALLLMKQNRFKEAESLIDQLNSPLHWGIYKLLTDNPNDAVNNFNKIMSMKDIPFESLVLVKIGLGLSYDSLQDYPQSKQSFQEAVDLIEKSRETTPIGDRTRFFEAVNFYFPHSEAYEGLSRVLYKQNQSDESFYWSEHIKARILLDSLARFYSGTKFALPENLKMKEIDLINRIASTKKRMDEAFEKGNKELRTQLESELKTLKAEQQTLINQLRKDYPEYASMQYPQPLKTNEIALEPNEVLIEYEVTDPCTLLFLVRNKKVDKTYKIDIKRTDLEEKIRKYRESFEDVGKTGNTSSFEKLDIELGNKLYNLLLKDALASVSLNEKILIVPDELLCLLPFEALVEELPAGKINWKDDGKGPYPEGVKFVGANRVFTYWQSASSMTVVRTLKKAVSGDKLLVVADPVYNAQDARLNKQQQNLIAKASPDADFLLKLRREVSDDAALFVGLKYFPRLEITSEFANNLQNLYRGQVSTLMGFDATETKVKKQLSNPYGKAVVFATHGILDERIPYYQQAALVLADPQIAGEQINKNDLSSNNDGFLTMAEIMDLKIPTEIVATLACETGVGTMVGGEGVMNLGRAFQYAGARSVLISLWSVGDESTNLFGEQFFSGLKNGESKDAALLATRQKLISSGYAHPFYWAPFILVGERDLSAK